MGEKNLETGIDLEIREQEGIPNPSQIQLDIPDQDLIQEEQDAYCINCSCCCGLRCIQNDEVLKARRDLFGIISDWFIDAGIGSLHIFRKDWLAGLLTFGIVFGAGVIITFTNFTPKKYGNPVALVKSEIRKMSRFYGLLMYIPSFFPICSAKLRLDIAKRLKTSESKLSKIRKRNQSIEDQNVLESEISELSEKMKFFKEKALWDSCCETFFESFPQAVLQILLLFRLTKKYDDFADYLPISSVFLALYGITGAPLQVLEARDVNMKWSFLEKISAYASNSLRVFSCALFILSILTFAKSEGATTWITILLISVSAFTIFLLMGGPHIIKYEVDSHFRKRETNCEVNSDSNKKIRKCPNTLVTAVGMVLTLISFYLWVTSQILPTGELNFRTSVVIGCFSFLMLFTCVGMLFYWRKLAVYHSIAADVPVSAYVGVKAWICKMALGITKKF